LTLEPDDHWYTDHRELATLTRWMADHGYSADQLADAVRRPWDHTTLYRHACRTIEHDD
jgi:hypothetical protein